MRIRKMRCFCTILAIYSLINLVMFFWEYNKTKPLPVYLPKPSTISIWMSKNHTKTPATAKAKELHSAPPKRVQVEHWTPNTQQQIKPGFHFSRGRTGVKWVIGLPTVLRPNNNYLLPTLEQLIKHMSPSQQRLTLIVIYVGETQRKRVKSIFKNITMMYQSELKQGLIDVVAPHADYYPNFNQLMLTLHDTAERVAWRTKQTLDYMYLMSYARSRGDYYLQLEDDLNVNAGYLDYIGQFVTLHSNFRLTYLRDWIVMSFCNLGFIGKLFNTTELTPFLDYVQLFYNDQPIDWLLLSYVKLRCCRVDSFHMLDCDIDMRLFYIYASQSQFQHVGVKSSLENKQQLLTDKRYDFDSGRQRMRHLRQPFNLMSSHLKQLIKTRSLEAGETFIWGYLPNSTSLLEFIYANQYAAGNFKIRSNKAQFNDVTIELQSGITSVPRNSSERYGFLMAYNYGSGYLKIPNHLLYFYVKEHDAGNGTSLFRRFSWSGAERCISHTRLWCLLFVCSALF